MKITRKIEIHETSSDVRIPVELEIELTSDELFTAYREQDKKYMAEDLENAFPDSEWIAREYGISAQEFEGLKSRILEYYEGIHDDETWRMDMEYAAEAVIDDYKKEKTE